MGAHAESRGWTAGCSRPAGPGVYEVFHMCRRMLVNVKRHANGELLVFGVPGHVHEGLPVSHFTLYFHPRSDDPRRSAASNLNEYDRAVSRAIAGATALRDRMIAMSNAGLQGKVFELAYGPSTLQVRIDGLYSSVTDREGVEKAVHERLGVWDLEDRVALPLPSEGPGAPAKGTDLSGRTEEL